MSSTVGHSLCGAAILMCARTANPRAQCLAAPGWLLLFAFAANLPDLDLLAGLAVGHFQEFHGGPTHSLLFCTAAAAAVGLMVPAQHRRLVVPWLVAAVFSHLIMDLLAGPALGLHTSYGTRLLWPWNEERIRAPFSLFLGVDHTQEGNLWDAHNVRVVAVEILSFAPLLAALQLLLRRRTARAPLAAGGRA